MVYCLLSIQSLDQAAVAAFEAHPKTGVFVEYSNLPEAVPQFLYIEHFKVEVDKVRDIGVICAFAACDAAQICTMICTRVA